MSLSFTPLIKLVREKFLKCIHALKESMDFINNVSDENYFIGTADYDPITSESFLDELCSEFSTEEVSIYYLDIDLAIVTKTVLLNPRGTHDEIIALKSDHSGLYDGSVEGSYFATDNNQAWSLFYDALEDIALLHIDDRSKLDIFKDSLLPIQQ